MAGIHAGQQGLDETVDHGRPMRPLTNLPMATSPRGSGMPARSGGLDPGDLVGVEHRRQLRRIGGHPHDRAARQWHHRAACPQSGAEQGGMDDVVVPTARPTRPPPDGG